MIGMLRVLLMLLCLPGVAQAHLLNMTRINVSVSDEGQAVVTMDVDLTKAMEGGKAYYALTQASEPQQSPRFTQLIVGLEQASRFTLGDKQLSWQLSAVSWPDAPAEDFTSGLAWPMTRFVFTLDLPDDFTQSALVAVFTDAFKFEEPIALNIS